MQENKIISLLTLALLCIPLIISKSYANPMECRNEINQFHCPSEKSILLNEKHHPISNYTEKNKYTLWEDEIPKKNISKNIKFKDVKETNCLNSSCEIICEYNNQDNNKDQLIKLTSIHQHFSYFIPESGGWKNKSCNKSRMDCKFYMVSHHNYSLSI